MVLKRVEKNELLELIAGRALQASDFKLTQDDRATVIDHPSSGSRFTIAKDFTPELNATVKVGNSESFHMPDTWTALKFEFGQWLDEVKVELNTPDLWEDLRRGSELLAYGQHGDLANTPFTHAEQVQIAQQLAEIKQYVQKNCELTAEQTARVDARFDAAEEASRRLGRKDWVLLFGGALLGTLTSALLPAHIVLEILTATAQGIGHLFGGGPPQLAPEAS